MGLWDNTAFVATADLTAVATALTALVAEVGRVPVHPSPRTPSARDSMQYGRAGDVATWGIALIAGAPGWTVLKTAPLELLIDAHAAEPPILTGLATRLGVYAFQHNAYDGDSTLLFEATPDGRSSVTGFCSHDPQRFHDDPMPGPDALEARLALADRAALEAFLATRVATAGSVAGFVWADRPPTSDAAYAELVAAEGARLRAWVTSVGGSIDAPQRRGLLQWRVPATAVVAALATAPATSSVPAHFGVDVVADAIARVFGDPARPIDNLVSVSHLVPHTPLAGAEFLYFAPP